MRAAERMRIDRDFAVRMIGIRSAFAPLVVFYQKFSQDLLILHAEELTSSVTGILDRDHLGPQTDLLISRDDALALVQQNGLVVNSMKNK